MPAERRPSPVGMRGWVLGAVALMGVWAFVQLDLTADDVIPGADDWPVIGRFFAHALTPALDFESETVGGAGASFFGMIGDAVRLTVVFAAAAMSLSLVIGLVLGFLASSAWWSGERAGSTSPVLAFVRRTIAPAIWGATRVVITLMRSVHELIWAVLFLAALGLNDAAAVIAIAIPYGGTLAKIFSEMIDEAPRDSALALRDAGASSAQVFVFGLLPRAAPDMSAYALYRFECALRSAAILGFFGWQTLGYRIHASWDEAHFGEVWTFLYALIALVIVVDWWSGALRRRFVA